MAGSSVALIPVNPFKTRSRRYSRTFQTSTTHATATNNKTLMDPLSASASIISIIQLSSEAVRFIGSASGAKGDRRRLREEIRGCSSILQQLKDDADDSEEGRIWSDTVEALEAPGGPLGRLYTTLTVLGSEVQPRDGIKGKLASLKWPFQEKEVDKIIRAIEREKSLLVLALTNDSRKLTQNIKTFAKENTKQLDEAINAIKARNNQFDKLEYDLWRVRGSQAGLKDGVDRLNDHYDSMETTENRKTILDWLTPTHYGLQQTDFFNKRQEGTGHWFLETAEYRTWLDMKGRTLFCPGIPGAGKTIITSVVVEGLLATLGKNPGIGIAYVYCNFRRQDEQKIDDLLASLLRQLAESQSPLPEVVQELYEKHKEGRTWLSLDDITRSLRMVAATYSRVFIVIDALDECHITDGSRARFLSEIFSIQTSSQANIFATSRFIPDITERFLGSIHLEIWAHDKDVRKYLEGRISQSGSKFLETYREEILNAIAKAVDGMFLLAQLHFDSIKTKKTLRKVKEALANLPTGSDAYSLAYQSAMERIEGQDADSLELAKNVLLWISCAERPLATSELQHALAVEVGDPELDEDNLPQVEDMVSVCAGLVTVDNKSRIIRLVHYTTQEYFEHTNESWFPDAQKTITGVCATYLSFDVFACGFWYSRDGKKKSDWLRTYPLYSYATHNWGHHASKSSSLPQGILDFLNCDAKVEASARELMRGQTGPMQVRGLHLAAHFGVKSAVQFLLHSNEVNLKDKYTRTPLWYAAVKGDASVVELLLDHGADVECVDDDEGRTPLYCAAIGGHEGAVRLLLDRGADPNAKESCWGISPIASAASEGHEGVVRMLMDQGADPELKDNWGRTPMSYAAEAGHELVVRGLLEQGANIELTNRLGWTTLSFVVGGKHDAMVRQQVARRVNPDWTPLSYAARGGHEATVRLLLDGGADLESKDKYSGRSSLSYAAEEGHESVVRLLLDRGADPMSGGSLTPLSYAAMAGHSVIFKLLESACMD